MTLQRNYDYIQEKYKPHLQLDLQIKMAYVWKKYKNKKRIEALGKLKKKSNQKIDKQVKAKDVENPVASKMAKTTSLGKGKQRNMKNKSM